MSVPSYAIQQMQAARLAEEMVRSAIHKLTGIPGISVREVYGELLVEGTPEAIDSARKFLLSQESNAANEPRSDSK